MKQFIEVTTSEGKRIINIGSISYIKETNRGTTTVILTSTSEKGGARFLKATESYDEIKVLIQEAL